MRSLRSGRSLLFGGGILALALPAGAQPTTNQMLSGRGWASDLSVGALVQPVPDGGTGGVLVMNFANVASHRSWSPAILVAAGRVWDVGAPGDNRYVIDRDWVVTAAGVETFVARAQRFALSVGAKGGVLWNLDRQSGVRGIPPSPFGPTNWEAKVGLIIDAGAKYRLGRALTLASRVGMVQHVFTDDMIGPTGALASLGVAFSW